MFDRSRAVFPILVVTLAVGGCAHRHSLPARAAPARHRESVVPTGGSLFNGRDLSGFYTWLVDTKQDDLRKVFSVTNGCLRISGDGLGYLATDASFQDYQLTIEYRWGETNTRWGDRVGRARDSGIFLHATGPDGNSHDGKGAFMAAIECNIFEGATGDFLLIRGDDARGRLISPHLTVATDGRRDLDGWPWWSPEGQPVKLGKWGRVNWRNKDPQWKDLTGFRGQHDLERSAGWNRIEITCLGDVIEIRLNGKLVNRATEVWPDRGKILLQCEGSEIFIRRLELRQLKQAAPVPRLQPRGSVRNRASP